MKDILSWNTYSQYQHRWQHRYFLVLKGEVKCLIIEKADYINFEEIVEYIKSLNLNQDEKLKANLSDGINFSNWENKGFTICVLSILSILISFWLITRGKSDSVDIQYVEGRIVEILYDKRHNDVDIRLEKYPDCNFDIEDYNDKKFFRQTKNDGFVNLGKEIKIGVLKSDFDWKVKNKFISSLAIKANLKVVEYKFINKGPSK